MKLMHISDLHIGKIIYEQSLLEDQEYMLNQIIKIIKNEKIEALLISGDIYDRAVPPAEAVKLLNHFLSLIINELKIKVFIISGNHDSKERLDFASTILENKGLYITTTYDGKIKYVDLENDIRVYMLPFVKPADVKTYFEIESLNEYSYNDAIKDIMSKEELDNKKINILMAHQFITNSGNTPETCESENISVGGVENVDVSNFENFDYVALGHIHSPQIIKRENIRYSGTMLKYSFSEANQTKSVVIIEINSKEDLKIKLINLKPTRDMRIIKGPVMELVKDENILENKEDYIKAIITDDNIPLNAIDILRNAFPNILTIEISNSKNKVLNETLEGIQKIKDKPPLELFRDFYLFQNGIEIDKETEELLKETIEGEI